MIFYLNECIFIGQALFIGCATLWAIWMGKETSAALTAVLVVLVNVFVRKQILFLGLEATASDALAIGITFNLNLLQEYYGKQAARKAIITSFFCAITYAVLSQIHLWYLASPNDVMHTYYSYLFKTTPRIVAASIVSFVVSSYLDYRLFGFFKNICGQRWLLIRNYGSISIAQAIDTLLFGFLGLYGLATNLWQIMIVSYAVKLAALFCTTPFVLLSKKLIPPQPNS